MCGIVGYVGPQQAQDVVIEGLRRLEYRGYDSAGIALVTDGTIASDKRAGKLANLEKAIADAPAAAVHDRDRAHPLGHPRGADRPQRPPAPRPGRPGGAGPQRHHRELRELRAELEAEGHDLVSDTDTEVAAHLLEAELERGGDLTTAMQASAGG